MLRSLRFRLVFALTLPLLGHLAAARAANPPAAVASGPRLSVATPAHDFGNVQQGEVVRYDFNIRNTGDQVLEILEVRPSCGCTTAGEWSRSLKPGESGSIPIKLDTAQFTGGITKTITLTTNDPSQPQAVLEVKGTIWTPVQISNPVVIFPAANDPNQVVTRAVTIRNQVEGALELTELRSEKPVFKPELKEIVPGKEFELQVTTVPPLATGTHTSRITMRSSNPKMPELAVQAVITVLPPVQVAPTEVVLSTEKLLAPEKRYVVVLNHRGYDLQLSELHTNATGVSFTTQRSGDNRQVTITLTFPAGFTARSLENLFFRGRTNHPDVPTFEVPIVFRGR